MKKRKPIKITLLCVLLVFVIISAVLCASHWDTVRLIFNGGNIVSFINSLRYTTEDLEMQLSDNKAKMETIARDNPHINIRGDLTEEEKNALKGGLITKEEAAGIIKGDTTLDQILASRDKPGEEPSEDIPPRDDPPPPQEQEPVSQEPAPGDTAEEETPVQEDRVSQIIAELYVVQADFISRLEALGDSAYEQYKATRYDRSQIMTIVDGYTATVAAMESECDNTVNNLLKELAAELTAVEGDLSVVKEIRKFYYDEKSLKKSYYLNRMYDEDYK